jgi:hypothetical protein
MSIILKKIIDKSEMPRWIRSRPAGRGLSKQALARIYWFTGMEMLGNRVLIVDQLEYI